MQELVIIYQELSGTVLTVVTNVLSYELCFSETPITLID